MTFIKNYLPTFLVFSNYSNLLLHHLHNRKKYSWEEFSLYFNNGYIHLFSELYKSVKKENMAFGCLYTIYFHNMLQFHVWYLFFWTPTHTTSPVLSQSVTDGACAFVRSKCVNTRCLSSTQMWTINAFVSICI